MGVVGRRVGFRASKWSLMDQHGPTWSQQDTKREPKATQMEPKGDQKIKKKQFSEKVRKCQFRDSLLRAAGDISDEKGVQKSPFGKSRKSEMAPKSNFSVKIGTGTL